MADSAAFARRTTKGGCSLAHIPGGLNAGVTGVVAGDDLATWVGATADGPTHLMINRAGVGPAGSTPEEIEVSVVSGNNITISARGLEGTSDASHPANSTIEVVSSPRDFDEANKLVNAILGISGLAAGDLLYLLSSTSFARLAKGTARQQLAVNAAATAPEWVASLQSLLTASGDIPYASAANTPARLAKGSDGQVLTLASGLPSWAAAAAAGLRLIGSNRTEASTTATSDTDILSVTGLTALDTEPILIVASIRGTSGVGTATFGLKIGASTEFAVGNLASISTNGTAGQIMILYGPNTGARKPVAIYSDNAAGTKLAGVASVSIAGLSSSTLTINGKVSGGGLSAFVDEFLVYALPGS